MLDYGSIFIKNLIFGACFNTAVVSSAHNCKYKVLKNNNGEKKKIVNYELTFNVMAIRIGVNFPNIQVRLLFPPFLFFASVSISVNCTYIELSLCS